MRLFAIDTDNTITAYPAAGQIPEGQEQFASEKELAKLAANWPSDRLLQIWNSFAGVAGFGADLKPLKKFTDRKSAIARIWKAIQKLEVPAATESATTAPKAAQGAMKTATATTVAAAGNGASTARKGSKKAMLLEMLRRKDGATLAEIAKATDWQNHSIRGFISGTLIKKMGLKVESTKGETGDSDLSNWLGLIASGSPPRKRAAFLLQCAIIPLLRGAAGVMNRRARRSADGTGQKQENEERGAHAGICDCN